MLVLQSFSALSPLRFFLSSNIPLLLKAEVRKGESHLTQWKNGFSRNWSGLMWPRVWILEQWGSQTSWESGGMTARSGKITPKTAVVILRLVMESAHSGADQVLSGGNQTKGSCECGAPAFRGGMSTVQTGCLSQWFWGRSEMSLGLWHKWSARAGSGFLVPPEPCSAVGWGPCSWGHLHRQCLVKSGGLNSSQKILLVQRWNPLGAFFPGIPWLSGHHPSERFIRPLRALGFSMASGHSSFYVKGGGEAAGYKAASTPVLIPAC